MFLFSLPIEGFEVDTSYRVRINGTNENVLVEKGKVTIDPEGRRDVRQLLDVTFSEKLVNFICSSAGEGGDDVTIIRPRQQA